MQSLHLVIGGHVADPRSSVFTNPADLHFVGAYPAYPDARKAWESHARRTVDDAAMKYVILDLHRLLGTGKEDQADEKSELHPR